MRIIKSGEYKLERNGTVTLRPGKTFRLPDLQTESLSKDDYMGLLSIAPLTALDDISIRQSLRNIIKVPAYQKRQEARHLALRNLYLIQSGIFRDFPLICVFKALFYAQYQAGHALLSDKERRTLENKRNPVVDRAYEFEIRADGRLSKNPKIKYQAPAFPKKELLPLPRPEDFTAKYSDSPSPDWMNEYEKIEEINGLKKIFWKKKHDRAHRKYVRAYRKQCIRDVIGYLFGREYTA